MVLKNISERYSVRGFSSKPVEDEKLREVLEAGRLSPSAKNRQQWKFVVIKDENKRKKLVDIAKGQKFVGDAPVVIAVCACGMDYRMTCGRTASIIDASIAATGMTLEAVEHGLGTCWIGAFYADKLAELINLPEDWAVVTLLPLGYPDATDPESPRKDFEEVVSFDSF
ncbi:MAG: nitroreductase family protein [bacterium]